MKLKNLVTLEITNIKVERLQDISEEDAVKEGFDYSGGFIDKWGTRNVEAAKSRFERFWNSTHKKPNEKYEANPFVWAVTLQVVK